jgi:hypothetical protein
MLSLLIGTTMSIDTPLFFMLCLTYSSTLKIEAMCFSEMLTYFHCSIRRYIPEEIILHPEKIWT